MRNFRTSEPTHFTTAATSVQDLAATPPDLTVIEVNTKGSLYTIHAALAYFRAQTPDQDGWRGKIVCTGSSASLYSFPNDALYATSKYGVLGMIRAIGPKVFREKITINGFGPSCVRTAIGPQDFFDKLEQQGRLTPMTTIASCMDMFLAPSSRLTGEDRASTVSLGLYDEAHLRCLFCRASTRPICRMQQRQARTAIFTAIHG